MSVTGQKVCSKAFGNPYPNACDVMAIAKERRPGAWLPGVGGPEGKMAISMHSQAFSARPVCPISAAYVSTCIQQPGESSHPLAASLDCPIRIDFPELEAHVVKHRP